MTVKGFICRSAARHLNAARLSTIALCAFASITCASQEGPSAATVAPHEQLVSVAPDARLQVLDWGGSGRAIVLLSGLGDTAHVFDKFAPRLARTYHVYGITRRGFEGSDSPAPTYENYNADRLGDDVLAVISALAIDRPIIVGHSIAGEELSSIGSRHPSLVSGLVYLDAGYSYALYDPSQGDLEVDLDVLRHQLDTYFNITPIKSRVKALEDMERELPTFEKDLAQSKKQWMETPEMSPEDIAKYEKLSQSPTPAMRIRKAILDGMKAYTIIQCPILAIYAEPHELGSSADSAAVAKDAAQVEAHARSFETINKQSKVIRIPNANHYVFRSNEGDVLREITTFIDALPALPLKH